MNKMFFLTLMVALVAMISTSCTNYRQDGPGVTKTVTTDTTITNHLPLLADRFDCNGNLLPQSKVTGWMIDRQHITQTTVCGMSDKELNSLGYFYKNMYNSGSWIYDSMLNTDPGWLLFWTLLFLVLLALLTWSLTRNNSNQPNNPPSQPNQPTAPLTPQPVAAVKNQANNFSANDMSEMLKAMAKNGGSLDTRADGSFLATFNPAKDENEPTKSPEVQADKTTPTQTVEEVKPAQ